MEEIKTYTLEELIKGKGNYGIAASAVPYNPSLRTYLRITDINDDGTLNKSSMMSVDEKNADAFLLKPNDIVFARTIVQGVPISMTALMVNSYMLDSL